MAYLSQESFSWIGAVEGENYLSKKDAITAFSRQRDLQKVPLIGVGKGRYHVQWVSDTVLLVLSVIPLSTKKETGLLLSENQRTTMIFHIEEDALRIVHIHVSNPWSMMPDKKRFPHSQGRSNYEYVQQVLSERTLSRYPDLSPRQKLILELLSQGKTYKAIAEALSISPRTVRYHVNELLTSSRCVQERSCSQRCRSEKAGLTGKTLRPEMTWRESLPFTKKAARRRLFMDYISDTHRRACRT